MAGLLSVSASAFGLGVALGASPGPVQVVLLTETTRGGARRGGQAMLGANGTFGLILLLIAGGLSAFEPSSTALRVLRAVGGAFLLFIAVDTIRSARATDELASGSPGTGLHPTARGVLAVLVNPGAWIFLATTASAVLAGAARDGGRPVAFAAALAMLAGVAVTDGGLVLVAAGSRKRLGGNVLAGIRIGLALILAAIAGLLLFEAIRG
jgi:threonine/homoserine/homoserine lactone efflux protein